LSTHNGEQPHGARKCVAANYRLVRQTTGFCSAVCQLRFLPQLAARIKANLSKGSAKVVLMRQGKSLTSEQFVFRCAGPNCGRLKGASDHWWLMWPSKIGDVAVLSICAWDDDFARREGALSVCGEQCAQKLPSMFMANILDHHSKGAR
jgi:hypothetical protein